MLLLNESTLENKKRILFFCNGFSQLENSYLMFQNNPDIEFWVWLVNNISIKDFYNSKLSKLPNLIVNENHEELLYKLEKFGMLITTVCSGAFCCRAGLHAISICMNIGIPVVELQHGLFEYGLSYNVEPVNYGTMYDFLNVDNFSDYLLSYYPIKTQYREGVVIGFPKYHLHKIKLPKFDANYVLILTNFNWDCFTSEDFTVFLGALLKVVTKYPSVNFLWKPHPAELHFFTGRKINLALYPNITITQDDPLTKLIPLDSLIKFADKVISTISTVLYDCEAYKKKTAIFNSRGNSALLSKLKKYYSFEVFEELELFMEEKVDSQIVTGMLLDYDN